MPRLRVIVAVGLLITGCATTVTTLKEMREVKSGELDYSPPKPAQFASNSDVMSKPWDIAWDEAVAALDSSHLKVDHADKVSGVIKITYSGSPKVYVDCGLVKSHLKGTLKRDNYEFAGAADSVEYKVWSDSAVVMIRRRMSLESNLSLHLESIGVGRERLTADARYVVTRLVQTRPEPAKEYDSFTDSIKFKSAETASFPAGQDGRALSCRPTGQLELEILSIATGRADSRARSSQK